MPTLFRIPGSQTAQFRLAIALWVIAMLVIGVMVAHNPANRTVTQPYHEASAAWWTKGNLYIGPAGMNYLPHFAVIFSLFHFLPPAIGEILWRFLAAALITTGLWRLVRLVFGDRARSGFFIGTLLTLPLSLAALRNGQANAVFGGLILHAAASLIHKKWWSAALLAVLATAIKPLGIVLVLLAPVLYGPLRLKMTLAFAALLLFPFLFATPDYAVTQYHAFADNLKSCAVVNDNSYADIGGVFRTFGVELPEKVSKAVRVIAGGLTLALWWWIGRPLAEPLRGLWLLALTTSYLMLFNPMNEANSYAMIAPVFAIWAMFFLTSEPPCRIGWIIVSMTLSMNILPSSLRPWVGNRFALFWHPLMAMLFMALLIFYFQSRPVHSLRRSAW